MNLYCRLIAVLVATLRGSRLDIFSTSVLRFRVWPTDLDVNVHMTNSRYHSLMDLGRMDFVARMGLLRLVLRNRWQPVIGGSYIRYRRTLNPFQRFTLHSRIVGWDQKWIYFEQRVEGPRGVAAIAIIRSLFLGKDGSVPTKEVLDLLGVDANHPPPESILQLWANGEAALDAQLANAAPVKAVA